MSGMSQSELEAFLSTDVLCRLGCLDEEGAPSEPDTAASFCLESHFGGQYQADFILSHSGSSRLKSGKAAR